MRIGNLKVERLTRITPVDGVNVYVHWSVLAIAAFILLGAIRNPVQSLVGLVAYFSILLIHECGHLFVAHRRHCQVYSIELYPIFGFTRFQTPWSRYDHALIAWGGVLAQAVVGIPLVLRIIFVGYTPFDVANEVFVLLGMLSLAIAAFNLLPFKPFDGATAWQFLPAYLERKRLNQKRRAADWGR